jgi:hypothetical protein
MEKPQLDAAARERGEDVEDGDELAPCSTNIALTFAVAMRTASRAAASRSRTTRW